MSLPSFSSLTGSVGGAMWSSDSSNPTIVPTRHPPHHSPHHLSHHPSNHPSNHSSNHPSNHSSNHSSNHPTSRPVMKSSMGPIGQQTTGHTCMALVVSTKLLPQAVITRDVWVAQTSNASVIKLPYANVKSKLIIPTEALRNSIRRIFLESPSISRDAFRVTSLVFLYEDSFRLELINQNVVAMTDTFQVGGMVYHGFFFVHEEAEHLSRHYNPRRTLKTGPELFAKSSLTEDEATILNSVLKRRKTDIGGALMHEFSNPADPAVFQVLLTKTMALYYQRIKSQLQEGFHWSSERIQEVLSDPSVEKNVHERLHSSLRYAVERWKEKLKRKDPGKHSSQSNSVIILSDDSFKPGSRDKVRDKSSDYSIIRDPPKLSQNALSGSKTAAESQPKSDAAPHQESELVLRPLLFAETTVLHDVSSDEKSETHEKKPLRYSYLKDLETTRSASESPLLKRALHRLKGCKKVDSSNPPLISEPPDANTCLKLLDQHLKDKGILDVEEQISSLKPTERKRLILEVISQKLQISIPSKRRKL